MLITTVAYNIFVALLLCLSSLLFTSDLYKTDLQKSYNF